LPKVFHGINLADILRQADSSFAPVLAGKRKHPRRLMSARGFIVEVLTTKGRRDEDVVIPGLGVAAIPLPYLDYLIKDATTAVASTAPRVIVRAPTPARYAIHKLIVYQICEPGAKRIKDLLQARELIAALREHDPGSLDEAIRAAEARGRSWKRLVQLGLAIAQERLISL
jgi:hypothetical protein